MVSRRASTSTRRRPHRLAMGLLATALLTAIGVLWIGAGAASPTVHEHVHHDASHADHVCAITLAALGYCDTGASLPDVRPTARTRAHRVAEPGAFAWTAPEFWLNPSQAPPIASA